TIGLIFLIMAFVLILFFCAEAIERRLLRWRYRGPSEKPAKCCGSRNVSKAVPANTATDILELEGRGGFQTRPYKTVNSECQLSNN
ncbi:MAG TPA: hypothetical protein VGK65_02750, partial [Candidatus Binatia bacterium]